ncbi:MAG: hypothetical protein LBE37_01820 [Sphingobacterium sp.]|nr:hypothetical protein [Sphingobacterium sp.]
MQPVNSCCTIHEQDEAQLVEGVDKSDHGDVFLMLDRRSISPPDQRTGAIFNSSNCFLEGIA